MTIVDTAPRPAHKEKQVPITYGTLVRRNAGSEKRYEERS